MFDLNDNRHRIDFNHVQQWLLTQNNAVGPTTSLTLRTLDNPAPTNANTIFLAMNGNDANPGTLALPVRTLEHAITLLIAGSPVFTTIHIFRNGFVGILDFITTATHSFPSTSIIQVELGEIATIEFNSSAFWINTSGSITYINGLLLNINNTNVGTTNTTLLMLAYISWCQFNWNRNWNGDPTDTPSFFLREPSIVKNSIFIDIHNTGQNTQGMIQSAGNPGVGNGNIFHDCLFVGNGFTALAISTYSDYRHCTFANISSIVRNNVPNSNTFEDCIIFQTVNFITNFGVSANFNSNTLKNCFFDMKPILSGYTNIIFNPSNQIGSSPLFFDPVNQDFRLMDERRVAPNSVENFTVNSKAVYWPEIGQVPGDDTRDLGPFDVSYTLITDTWLPFYFDPNFWSDPAEYILNLINNQKFNDIRGNFHRVFDAPKRTINLKMLANNFMGTIKSYEMQDLFSSQGSKKWFPRGDMGIYSAKSCIITSLPDGTFLCDIPIISLQGRKLNRNQSRGWIFTLTQDYVNFFYLQVVSNDWFSAVLRDHRGNQALFTPGIWDIYCNYLPVDFDGDNMLMKFQFFITDQNPLRGDVYPPNTKATEGNVFALTMQENEDDV